jgi:cell division protein FtsL
LRQRGRQIKNDGFRNIPFKYNVNWTCPTILVSVIAFLVVLYLCQCAQLTGVQYRVGQLKEQKKALITQQKEIRVSIEKLESLERIEKIAISELGMVYPKQRYLIAVKHPSNSPQTAQDDIATVPIR